jgi:hypothetical protein
MDMKAPPRICAGIVQLPPPPALRRIKGSSAGYADNFNSTAAADRARAAQINRTDSKQC